MVASIDFGTSKIVALVAENSTSTRCDIVAAGVARYDGYINNSWNNPQQLDNAILTAIRDAETQNGNRRITKINVGVPGAFSKVYVAQVSIPLSGVDPCVTGDDIKAIFAKAREELQLQQIHDEEIHFAPAWFRVDNGKKCLRPVGLRGKTLTGMISFVIGNRFFLDDITARLRRIGIDPSFYSTIAGQAMLYLPQEHRARTAVLIDVGYLSTDVSVVMGDAVVFYKNIEIGGGHFAADLPEELGISFEMAEMEIKRKFNFDDRVGSASYLLPVMGEGAQQGVSGERIAPIITARVDELADEIRAAIEESGVTLTSDSNYYLTGGGLCLNPGGRTYLGEKIGHTLLELPRRTNRLSDPVYTSVMGLTDLVIDVMDQNRKPESGVAGVVKSFFRSLIGG